MNFLRENLRLGDPPSDMSSLALEVSPKQLGLLASETRQKERGIRRPFDSNQADTAKFVVQN